MALLTSGGEMIRTVHEMFVRPDWVHFFLHLQCALCICIHTANNKILQLDDT